MVKLTILALIAVVFGASSIALADNVPVLVWGNFNRYTPVIALKTHNSNEFLDILSNYLNEDTFAVVIAEDTLSTEDFSSCKQSDGATCFQNIQQIPSKLYLSSVEDPIAAIDSLAATEKSTISIDLNDAEAIDSIVPEMGKVVFVNFDDDESAASDKTNKFTRHDQLISQLSKKLAQNDQNLLVIYTGKQSSAARSISDISLARYRREVAAAAAATAKNETAPAKPVAAAATGPKADPIVHNGTFWQRERFQLYYTVLEEIVDATDPSKNVPLDFTTIDVALHELAHDPPSTQKTQYLTVALSEAPNRADAKLTFNVTEYGGFWLVQDINFGSDKIFSETMISANTNFSFACNPNVTFSKLVTVPPNSVRVQRVLLLGGLHIEPDFSPFYDPSVTARNFSQPWDCVGFTSGGIWGGLFVTLLMLIILTIGISWMMEIRTMDRFDDPKAKTITINASE